MYYPQIVKDWLRQVGIEQGQFGKTRDDPQGVVDFVGDSRSESLGGDDPAVAEKKIGAALFSQRSA
jgi:hypothetical protein